MSSSHAEELEDKKFVNSIVHHGLHQNLLVRNQEIVTNQVF